MMKLKLLFLIITISISLTQNFAQVEGDKYIPGRGFNLIEKDWGNVNFRLLHRLPITDYRSPKTSLGLQVLVDVFRLPQQVRHMAFIVLQETGDHLHAFFELQAEFLVLLIPPRGAQGSQLVRQRTAVFAQIVVEFLQVPGKIPQFFRIDNRLRHDSILPIPNYSFSQPGR